MKERDTALQLNIASQLLLQVAEDYGFDPSRLHLRDRFQIRDPQIEHIGWALLTEAEHDYPSGELYLQSMATALAIQLLCSHSTLSSRYALPKGSLPARTLKHVLAYIEENLSGELDLQSIANAAGISVSHLKVLFRRSVGMPVHQYVIRRRVERAVALLQQGRMPVSQVALEAGFAHQSHLSLHMRRILGISPKHLVRVSTA